MFSFFTKDVVRERERGVAGGEKEGRKVVDAMGGRGKWMLRELGGKS